jgi:hypothetical protein
MKGNQLTVVIGVAVLILGFFIFTIGFHNVDICHNGEAFNYILSIESLLENGEDNSPQLGETKLNGEYWSYNECYINGLGNLNGGIFIAILGAFIFGYSFGKK